MHDVYYLPTFYGTHLFFVFYVPYIGNLNQDRILLNEYIKE